MPDQPAPAFEEALYVCENCGRLAPITGFNDDCAPGWTHGKLIKVDPTSAPLADSFRRSLKLLRKENRALLNEREAREKALKNIRLTSTWEHACRLVEDALALPATESAQAEESDYDRKINAESKH